MVITTKTVLFKGSTETENIKTLQTRLQGLGYYKYKIDGKFLGGTFASVETYEKDKKLKIDGIAGPIVNGSLGLIKTPTPSNKSAFHLMIEDHVKFKYNTWTEFFNGMSSKGYSYYYDDIYPQGQALDRLKANSGLNCADVSQIGYAVAKDLGLEVHYGHLKGHIVNIIGSIKNGTIYDLARKISVNSPFTGPGDHWCSLPFLSYDDPWLLSDDGFT
jgi:peptidoglycan hydrolase-like protein with peptidoglycan-binding domain